MLNSILLVLLFLAVSLLDLPSLIKKKDIKQIIVYSSILGVAFLLTELHTFRVHVPSPDRLITNTVNLLIKW
jgi:hypothetical protein